MIKHARLIDFGARQNDILLLGWRLSGIVIIQLKQSYCPYWLQGGVCPEWEVQVWCSSIWLWSAAPQHSPHCKLLFPTFRREDEHGLELALNCTGTGQEEFLGLYLYHLQSLRAHAMDSTHVTYEPMVPCSWHAPKSPQILLCEITASGLNLKADKLQLSARLT